MVATLVDAGGNNGGEARWLKAAMMVEELDGR